MRSRRAWRSITLSTAAKINACARVLNDMEAVQIDTVLFDLDGTLLDTADDMGAALNAVLRRHQRAPLSAATIRPHVSKGGMALIGLGFQINGESESAAVAESAQAETLRQEFLSCYAQNLSANTRLFPGIEKLLTRIEQSHRRWGIVTNKPAFLTEPLLRDMNLTERVACVVSGDTLATRKPSPEPLLHACQMSGGEVARAVYIGDDARDIEAGRRAGMRTLAAAYGYILPHDDPHQWGADAVVHHADEICSWLESR